MEVQTLPRQLEDVGTPASLLRTCGALQGEGFQRPFKGVSSKVKEPVKHESVETYGTSRVILVQIQTLPLTTLLALFPDNKS